MARRNNTMLPATSVQVYEPEQRARMGFFECWFHMITNVLQSRELIWQLFKRDVVSTYNQSFLGIFWILVSPLIGIVSWLFMNYAGVLRPGDVGVPYAVYLLFGTTIWGTFMGFYSASASGLSSGGSLILQVNFSHEALVAQQIAQTVVNLLVNLVTLAGVLFVFSVRPHWTALFFPLTIVPLFFLGTAIGMVVSVFSVVVHDVTKMVTTGLGLLLFATPVIYGPNIPNRLIQDIIWWNPLTYLIGAARDIVLYGRFDHPRGYAVAVLLSSGLFLLSWRLFFLSERKVAEKL
jgi:ABC-type polysaccharide/polyol phosphate export permease